MLGWSGPSVASSRSRAEGLLRRALPDRATAPKQAMPMTMTMATSLDFDMHVARRQGNQNSCAKMATDDDGDWWMIDYDDDDYDDRVGCRRTVMPTPLPSSPKPPQSKPPLRSTRTALFL